MYLSSCLSLTSSIALGKLKSSFLLFKYLEKFKLSLGKHGPEYNAPMKDIFFYFVSCPIAFSIFDVLSLEFLSEICEIVFVNDIFIVTYVLIAILEISASSKFKNFNLEILFHIGKYIF